MSPLLFLQENRKLLSSCCNMLYPAPNGFTAWQSNQHLHHHPLRPKNTSAGIISPQGASYYLTLGLLDPCMDITHGN